MMQTFAEIDWRRLHAHATKIHSRGTGRDVWLTADFDFPGLYRKPPEPRTALESMAQAWGVLSARKLNIDPCPECGAVRHELGLFEDGRRTAWCGSCKAWTKAPEGKNGL